jgi:urea transporter
MCRTLAAMLAMALVMLLHNDYAAIMGSMQVLTALALGLTARRMQRATPGVG